ncbi:MAG TPA: hypothetical protein VD967_01040 [Candidatus Paceibacterota bacterium]|nr:hypothetical protein [Candidatus Paceibacterota bacterium]
MQVVRFGFGCDITRAAEELVVAAAYSLDGKARGNFNGVTIVARPTTASPEALVSQWRRKMDAKDKRYQRSAKAKAAKRKWAAHEAEVQARHDELMRILPHLDFSNDVGVLAWLCEFQNPSDSMFVKGRDPLAVLAAFARHGYFPVEKVVVFDRNDRASVANVIIVQALSGLASSIGAIHQVIHYHVEDWKKRFISVH